MKTVPSAVCPGCKKHCPAGAPKCKFGRTYFAREERKSKESQRKDKSSLPAGKKLLYGLRMPDKKRTFKWDKDIVPGGLAWKLFFVSRSIKRVLHHSPMTEERIFGALTQEERETLSSILEKLNESLY